LGSVQTNMVMVRVEAPRTAPEVVSLLGRRGVRCSAVGPDLIRLVTHLAISSEDVAYALAAAREVLR